MRRIRLLFLLALVVFTITSCKVKVAQETFVLDDGSGEVVVVVMLDEELRELVGFVDAESTFALAGGVPEGFSVANVIDGEFQGARAVRTFADLDEFADVIADITASSDLVEALSLERQGNQYRYEATIGNIQDVAAAANLPGVTAETFDEFFEIRLSLLLPGDLADHNADEVSPAGSLAWFIHGDDSGRVLTATSRVTSPLVPWALGLAGLLVLVGGGVAWWRMRRSSGPEALPGSQVT
ncbi:MAG: hypothetical protein OEO77_03845 [Acidimicrobiia bacterium]|nr:hypothetical protein [Acidimicrobiia bacterium]